MTALEDSIRLLIARDIKSISSCAKIYITEMIKVISPIADDRLYPIWAYCENPVAFPDRFSLPVFLFKLQNNERKMKILFHFLSISTLVYESVSWSCIYIQAVIHFFLYNGPTHFNNNHITPGFSLFHTHTHFFSKASIKKSSYVLSFWL